MISVSLTTQIDDSPVALSYAAALRNVKPRSPQTPFTYAVLKCKNIHGLLCLAASNPEGKFLGVVGNVGEFAKAEAIARARRVRNVSFYAELAFLELAKKEAGASTIPPLDYVVLDESQEPLTPEERKQYFEIAEKKLKPNGLLAYSYRACDKSDDHLNFLIKEFVPEFDAGQKKEFLQELKDLGAFYFDEHAEERQAIDKALENNTPDDFFTAHRRNPAIKSAALETMVDLMPRGFALAGSANPADNYMELSTPTSAHRLLAKCAESVLYESIKDFAANRQVRHDVWCRMPADQTDDPVELFGSFTFGLAALRDKLPDTVITKAKTLDFKQPVMAKLIEVMALLPMGIGDFLQHPNGKGIAPNEALSAVQALVAAGVARPMRGHFQHKELTEIGQLKWATEFNNYLNETPITDAYVLLASQTIGGGVKVPAREALVMQAINRVGMANSVDALMLELMRVAGDPSLAAKIMDTADPTPESAHNMVNDVVNNSILRWYAYGLLAA